MSEEEQDMPQVAGCPNLGHLGECDNNGDGHVSEEVDSMLGALASVVVDELIRLKATGMAPSEIEAVYGPQEVSL
jgi:hypothetical protein